MRPIKLNMADVAWESYAAPKGRFGSEDKDLTTELGAKRMDVTLTRLQPGQVSCPFHFHHVNEEIFVVMEGKGTVRLGERTGEVGPGDVVVCPPGPEGAHQFLADRGEPLVYLAISTEDPVELCEYPDSDKMMAYVRGAAKFVLPRKAVVDYWEGEA